jgi:hypothetical protein
MSKVDIEVSSKRSQRTVGYIKQGICIAIIRRFEPFAFEDSPKRLGDIQMRVVWWQKKRETARVSPTSDGVPA